MGDIGEGTAVNQRRRMLQRLNQVGLKRILQQCRHRAYRMDIPCGNGLSVKSISHYHSGQPFLQIVHILRQAENSHNFRCNGNDKMILPYRTVHFISQTHNNVAQHTVIHIQAAFPDHLSGINTQFISLLNMIIKKSGT